MRRIPNLEAAIEECRRLGIAYQYEKNRRNDHYKFYVGNCKQFITVSCKKDNSDRIRKSITKVLTGSNIPCSVVV